MMRRLQYSGRTDQSKAGQKRLVDAKKLFLQKRWRGAMYLAGYSIECRLKVKLMEMYDLDSIQELEKKIEDISGQPENMFTHSLERLFALTGAKKRLLTYDKNGKALRAFHSCNTWSTSWRYNPDDGNEEDCEEFLRAVSDFGQFIDQSI